MNKLTAVSALTLGCLSLGIISFLTVLGLAYEPIDPALLYPLSISLLSIGTISTGIGGTLICCTKDPKPDIENQQAIEMEPLQNIAISPIAKTVKAGNAPTQNEQYQSLLESAESSELHLQDTKSRPAL